MDSTAWRPTGFERGGGLVHDEQLGRVDLCLGDAEPLALAAREAADRPVGLVREPDELEHLVDAVLDRPRGTSVEEARGEAQRLPRRLVLVEARVLRQEADAAAHLEAVAGRVPAQHLGAPRARPREPDQHAHRRRLAGAVGAEEAEHGVARHP
jgi:hypothetical protein